jgi:cytoskeleton protein RodZ
VVLVFLPAFTAGLETVKNGLAEVAAVGGLSPASVSRDSQNTEPGSTTSQSDQNADGAKPSQTLSTQSAVPPLLTSTLAVPTASGSESTSAASSGTGGLLPATSLSANGASVKEAVTGVVVFTAKDTSWIEVTDASRQVVLRRTLNPGESVGANGVLPLPVIVGRADATEVLVRGKSFELATYSSSNVARFEVK